MALISRWDVFLVVYQDLSIIYPRIFSIHLIVILGGFLAYSIIRVLYWSRMVSMTSGITKNCAIDYFNNWNSKATYKYSERAPVTVVIEKSVGCSLWLGCEKLDLNLTLGHCLAMRFNLLKDRILCLQREGWRLVLRLRA